MRTIIKAGKGMFFRPSRGAVKNVKIKTKTFVKRHHSCNILIHNLEMTANAFLPKSTRKNSQHSQTPYLYRKRRGESEEKKGKKEK